MTWDTTTPAGTDSIKDGDDVIRTFKTDIQTALQANGHFPINTSSPEYHYIGDRGTTASMPTNGEGGLYADTDKSALYRDNGSSWDAIATLIPAGTNMIFYEATAPTGWTLNNTADDHFLRVETSGGGSTGGSWSNVTDTTSSSGSHDHTVDSHTHGGEGTLKAHIGVDTGAGGNRLVGEFDESGFTGGNWYLNEGMVNATTYDANNAVRITGNTDGTAPGTDSQGAHTHSVSCEHVASDHSYANVMICTKDAYS